MPQKKVRMWEMKCRSVGESLFESVVSAERSISSEVQKDASAFLYILRQMLSCWMGKRTKQLGFAWSNGSPGQDGRLSRRSCAVMLCVVTAVSWN